MQLFRNPQLSNSHKANKGFTLLEVLLAIGITAMIGLGSWQILNSAIGASDSTQTRLAELHALQKTMLIISRDLRQVVTRSIRDGYGDYQPALTTKNEFYALEFSRTGWRNPMDDVRSNIQRVAYELNDKKLIRHYWNVLDRSQDSDPISKELLSEVNEISIRFVDKKGAWVDQWPASGNASSSGNNSTGTATPDPRANDNELPKALEISFDLQRFGKVKRLYDLPVYLENLAVPVTTPPPAGAG